jgi:hypothetical protein
VNEDLVLEQARREAGRMRFQKGRPIRGEDAFRRWLATCEFKRSTSATNRAAVENHLIPYFGDMDLRRLTRLDIRQFADRCFTLKRLLPDGTVEHGLSEATVRNCVSILRRVINTLVLGPEVEEMREHPVPRPMMEVQESARAHPGRKATRRREAWSPEEAWILVDLAKQREPAWYPPLFFLFRTGARLSEVIDPISRLIASAPTNARAGFSQLRSARHLEPSDRGFHEIAVLAGSVHSDPRLEPGGVSSIRRLTTISIDALGRLHEPVTFLLVGGGEIDLPLHELQEENEAA